MVMFGGKCPEEGKCPTFAVVIPTATVKRVSIHSVSTRCDVYECIPHSGGTVRWLIRANN